MESTEEPSYDQIQPPHLEDAGLEDCALPPEAIQEAFLKAAMSARSIISDSDDDEDDDDEDDEKNEYGVVGLDVLEEGEACVEAMHGLKVADKQGDNIKGKIVRGKNDGNVDEEKEEDMSICLNVSKKNSRLKDIRESVSMSLKRLLLKRD